MYILARVAIEITAVGDCDFEFTWYFLLAIRLIFRVT